MVITKWWMDNIESYIWLFCLDHPDTNITQVSDFIEWIFATGNYIFPKVFTGTPHVVVWMRPHLMTGIINFDLLVPREYHRYFDKFYAYPDSDPTAMQRAPWAMSLRCQGAVGMPPETLQRVCCDATATCFWGDLPALVLSMFKTWLRPRRPWRPYCDLQRYHSALWDLTTTQRRSITIWLILQIAARSPSCVTGVWVLASTLGLFAWSIQTRIARLSTS